MIDIDSARRTLIIAENVRWLTENVEWEADLNDGKATWLGDVPYTVHTMLSDYVPLDSYLATPGPYVRDLKQVSQHAEALKAEELDEEDDPPLLLDAELFQQIHDGVGLPGLDHQWTREHLVGCEQNYGEGCPFDMRSDEEKAHDQQMAMDQVERAVKMIMTGSEC